MLRWERWIRAPGTVLHHPTFFHRSQVFGKNQMCSTRLRQCSGGSMNKRGDGDLKAVPRIEHRLRVESRSFPYRAVLTTGSWRDFCAPCAILLYTLQKAGSTARRSPSYFVTLSRYAVDQIPCINTT